MDELIKGVKIGKIIGKEEKKSDVVKIVVLKIQIRTFFFIIKHRTFMLFYF